MRAAWLKGQMTMARVGAQRARNLVLELIAAPKLI